MKPFYHFTEEENSFHSFFQSIEKRLKTQDNLIKSQNQQISQQNQTIVSMQNSLNKLQNENKKQNDEIFQLKEQILSNQKLNQELFTQKFAQIDQNIENLLENKLKFENKLEEITRNMLNFENILRSSVNNQNETLLNTIINDIKNHQQKIQLINESISQRNELLDKKSQQIASLENKYENLIKSSNNSLIESLQNDIILIQKNINEKSNEKSYFDEINQNLQTQINDLKYDIQNLLNKKTQDNFDISSVPFQDESFFDDIDIDFPSIHKFLNLNEVISYCYTVFPTIKQSIKKYEASSKNLSNLIVSMMESNEKIKNEMATKQEISQLALSIKKRQESEYESQSDSTNEMRCIACGRPLLTRSTREVKSSRDLRERRNPRTIEFSPNFPNHETMEPRKVYSARSGGSIRIKKGRFVPT